MSATQPSRAAPVPGQQPGRGAGSAVARSGRWAVRRTQPAVVGAGRWLAHEWRSSLQFRVISVTVLLTTVVVLLLGTSLYARIADGLVADRQSTALGEAARGAREAQSKFDSADRADTESLGVLARDVVSQLASSGTDQSRQVLLTRALSNAREAVLPTVASGSVGIASVPTELRRAISSDPRHQHFQIVTVQDAGGAGSVPAVIVGSRVSVSVAGAYDLLFVFPMRSEQRTLALVANTFALGGLALVLLVGAVAYVVTRLVVSPVRRAAEVAERLASGRLHERMRPRGQDDLARLAGSFNAMADSLQQQIRQLEDLSRVQQRFVSDVSHELRTPLTTIRMAADLLHEARHGFDPTAARSAELLFGELDRFEGLLSDLLEISRFDAGAAVLELEATDLRDTVARVVGSTSPLATRRGIELVVHAPPEPCIAEVDPRRVERILRNLVVNAVEHGEGRPVEVSVAVNSRAAAVTVRDHGVGLREGQAALVFNRFWRADPARARTTGGTGLGLSIALEDALLHDGWLQAWGEVGTGSCFRLTIPRKAGQTIKRSPLPLTAQELRAHEQGTRTHGGVGSVPVGAPYASLTSHGGPT